MQPSSQIYAGQWTGSAWPPAIPPSGPVPLGTPALILGVCSGSQDSHLAAGMSDMYTGTVLDGETEGLLEEG